MFVTLWMTVAAFNWSIDFATYSDRAGMDIAVIIAAIMSPLSALQAAVFTFYVTGERNDDQFRD